MFKSKKVRVEFFEVDEGRTIGYDEKKLKDIPATFEHETFVEIEAVRYRVVGAEPDNRKALKDADLLVVNLQREKAEAATDSTKAETYNPVLDPNAVISEKTIREPETYLRASRPQQRPSFTGDRSEMELLEMAGYEYRDYEFVADTFREAIRNEFRQIARIQEQYSRVENERTYYSQQHRRNYATLPLGTQTLSTENLYPYFPNARVLNGFTFMSAEGYADEGFALRLPSGMALYGIERQEEIRSLNLAPNSPKRAELLGADLKAMVRIMEEQNWLLVDWEEMKIYEADINMLAEAWGETVDPISPVEELAPKLEDFALPAPDKAVAATIDAGTDVIIPEEEYNTSDAAVAQAPTNLIAEEIPMDPIATDSNEDQRNIHISPGEPGPGPQLTEEE